MRRNIDLRQLFRDIKLKIKHHQQIYKFNRSPLRKREPLLVYQMGKVGSSSVRGSLIAADVGLQPYHLHYMSGIDYMVDLCRKQSVPLREHILSSIYCKKMLKERSARGEKTNIISMVRDPIAKNISQFFQSIVVSYPEYEYSEKLKNMEQDEFIEDLMKFFIDNFRHDDPLVWFDVEMKRFTGIDVYEHEFAHDKGYKIYQNKIFRLLLVRLEDMNACIPEAMDRFLGIKDFTLINENISSKKGYAGPYSKMKERIKLPRGYIDKMYSSKMAKHFYTEAERKKFEKKWCKA